MYTLDVDASTPYRVHIGTFLLERVGAIAREAAGGRRAVIVTDSNVGPLYAAPVKTGLEEAGYETGVFTFEAGERSKRAQTYISILEYLASTLYHAIQVPGAKRIFRIIDHSCIYLLIAGSYTPFLLITLEPYGGIVMFVVIWALAFAGISFEIIGRQRQPRWVTITIYLVMGWPQASTF